MEAGDLRDEGATAGGDEEDIIGLALALVRGHDPGRTVDAGHLVPGVEDDVVVDIPVERIHEDVGGVGHTA